MTPALLTKNLDYRSVAIGFTSWAAGYIAIQTSILYFSLKLPFEHAVKDAIVTNVIAGLGSFAIVNVIRFYQPRQILRLIDSIGLALLSSFITGWITKLWIHDVSYAAFVDHAFLLRSFFMWMMISLFALTASLLYYLREQQETKDREATSEKLAREAELARLRQQLQPHFLFNSLNSISALAGSKPEQARKMIQQLSDFLRGTLRKDDSQFVTFSEELEHLNLYLEIEKVRFGHRMKTHIEVADDALNLKLPSLLLQPVVENAIKFGLYDTTGEIVIRLLASRDDGYLVITIENPYDRETSSPKKGTGFGLNSVQRRLHLLFARQDLLSTSQDDTTFTTFIKIPQT